MSFGFGASSHSLFGAPQSQSLFGSQQSQPLFGQSSQSLFGSQPQSQSLFGASSSAQSAPSLFGAQPQSQSLFGQSSQSLFGAPQSQSLFGGAPQSQPLFGAQSQSAFGQSQSLFGAPQSQPLFGASQPAFGSSGTQIGFDLAAAQPQQPQQQPQLPRALMDLVERLNPMHPESKFHAALYNVVSPKDVSRYTRPPVMDEKLWDTAVAKNPDPSRMVPVQANNFDDLQVRAEMQESRLAEHAAVLGRLEDELEKLGEELETQVETKLAMYRRRHRELARKLLRVATTVEMAVSRGGLSQSEIERKKRLDAIAKALAAPAEFKDKLSDLVELAESTVLDRRVHEAVEVRDARAAAVIRGVLTDQLEGIRHLGDVCERCDRDIGIMADGLAER